MQKFTQNKKGKKEKKNSAPPKKAHKNASSKAVHSVTDTRWSKLRALFADDFVDVKGKKWTPPPNGVVEYGPPPRPITGEVLASMQAAGALVSAAGVYTFRLTSQGILTTNGSGVCAAIFPFDPSTNTEFSTYLVNLFTECRFKRSRLWVRGIGTIAGHAFVATNLAVTSTVPASANAVIQLADSVAVAADYISGGGWDGIHGKSAFISSTPNTLWAAVGTPAPAIDQGCYGGVQLYTSFTAANSSDNIAYFMELYIEFRNRS